MVHARSPERLGVCVGRRGEMICVGVMRVKKRLVYSSPRGYSCRTPSVRYVSGDASYCTYTAVEKEVPWHITKMLHHGRERVPTLRHPEIVPHFETRTVKN